MARRDPDLKHRTERKLQFLGWKTTDQEEIERRRLRALSEPFSISSLDAANPVFGTFLVKSENGASDKLAHIVEIRALEESHNSCSCPDYLVNGLGTCKHIEAVVRRVVQELGPASQNGAGHSDRIEIFLARHGRPEVRIAWPKRIPVAARSVVDPFFSRSGALLDQPLTQFPGLAKAMEQAPRRVRKFIRVARDVEPWIQDLHRKQEREQSKQNFLADVRDAKRYLNCVKVPLYPYQQDGVLHLAFGERVLLADEMGLGKTVQAIAACELLRQTRNIERVLVVSPASLKAEWQEQIARFADLQALPIWGPRAERLRALRRPSFFYLANYEQIRMDVDDINTILAPDVVILDEAQRIKNWQTATAGAVKRLASRYAFVLTGTPLENRIDEIYSIFQFLDPHVLGPLFRFNREFYELDERGRPIGYQNLDELHRRIRPLMLRRRKSEVEDQLPKRTVNNYFVAMDAEQRARYDEYQTRVARLVAIAERRQLTREESELLQKFLACMRMICDTPFILDPKCSICPKLRELESIIDELLVVADTKVLIFSEWERMLDLVRPLIEDMGAGLAWHTGSVPQKKRAQEVRRFKNDPGCRVFLSTDAGSVGLNLQAANVVINLDLPWNPARLEQRIARAWRKHQTRPVTVINLVSQNTIEHGMLGLLERKQELADEVVDGRGRVRSMTLRSGRRAMIERIQSLMAANPDPAVTQTATSSGARPLPDPYAAVTEALTAGLGKRLLLVEQRSAPGSVPCLMAVVEPPAGQWSSFIEKTVHKVFRDSSDPPRLEVLDRSVYETILRLADAGIVSPNTASLRRLHESHALNGNPNQEEIGSAHRKRAESALRLASRKLQMAGLLSDGGFALEALPALHEAIENTLTGLSAFIGTEPEEPASGPVLAPGFVESRLIEPGFLPAWASEPIARLRAFAKDGSDVSAEEASVLHRKVCEIHHSAVAMIGLASN